METSDGPCRFTLRDDMPPGFVQNMNYPELPATARYLRQHDGKTFESPAQFKEQVLSGLLLYFGEQQVPEGADPLLRSGLQLEELPVRYRNWDYMVLTPATNGPGKCVFGGLEMLAKE